MVSQKTPSHSTLAHLSLSKQTTDHTFIHTPDSQGATKQKRTSKLSLFGFTLVELIVVITILAILGTIGFLSIGGYSSRARDSARVADTANISKSLDLSIITMGTYPIPDSFFSVTYSGGVIWKQGVVGSTVIQALKSSISGGGLSKKPVDPLDNKEYTYSSLRYGNAYQIKVNYEGGVPGTAYNIPSLINSTYAAPTTQEYDPKLLLMEAYIRGNYGGLTAKTATGSNPETDYLLAIPSIITNTGSVGDTLAIEADALSGALLFNGKPLINGSSYNPNATSNSGVVYTSTGGALSSDATTTIVTNLQAAYTNTDLTGNSSIASLLATTGSTNIANYGVSIVNNQLGGKLSGGGGGGTTTGGGGGGGGGGTSLTLTSPSYSYNFRTYTFPSFTLVYGSPQTLTSNTFSLTHGTITYTATFTLGSDGTTVTRSGESESVSCSANYSGTTCQTYIPSVTPATLCTLNSQVYTGSTYYGAGDPNVPDCDTPDIIICTGSGVGMTWAACNAGATAAWTGQTFSSQTVSRDTTINIWAGGLYQWGRNDNVASQGTPTTTLATGSLVGHTNFIKN